MPYEEVLEEAQKCQIICCMCHDMKTVAESNNSSDGNSEKVRKYLSAGCAGYSDHECPSKDDLRNFFDTVDENPCLPGSAKSRVLHYDHENPLSKHDTVGNIPLAERELEIEKCIIRCHVCHVVKTEGNYDIQFGLLRAGIFGRKNGYRRAKAQQDELANMLQYK